MLIWIIFALLAGGVTAAILFPLSAEAKAAGGGFDAGKVYRDQLSELEAELAVGKIAPGEYEAAKAETARRLFRAMEGSECPAEASGRIVTVTKSLVAIFVPLASIGLYIAMGSPEVSSKPLAARLAQPTQDLAILVRKTEEHLAKSPDDGRGWEVIAPVHLKSGRVADAEKAYRNAIRLLGPSAMRLDGLAESLMAGSNGMVTPEVRQTLEQSLSLEPDNPRAKFYVALSLEQDGETDRAKAAFEAIAKESPADAPWLPLVNDHIVKNGGAPVASGKAPGGPTQEDVAAAQNMTPADQQQMIRGMIESLNAKLKADPNNFEGWVRLVRSYAVLNDKDRAADALKRGLAVFPVDGDQGRQLLEMGRELGIATEGVTE